MYFGLVWGIGCEMSTFAKKIVEYHISRLQDKDPNARLKAIRELELLGDVAALEPLQNVFKNDYDPNVRKAAQEAGRAIYVKHHSNNVSGGSK